MRSNVSEMKEVRGALSRRSLFSAALMSVASAIPAFASSSDLQSGPRASSSVALTFHGAGEDSINAAILKQCSSADIPITIFAVGTWLQQSPQLAKKFFDAGNEIGNHTLNHKSMRRLSAKSVLAEISGGAAELKKLFGNHGVGFRPSGTQFSTPTIRKAAESLGYKQCISYDVDSLDYQDPPVTSIIGNVSRSLKSGSIVSLHFGHANTVRALPQIFALLEANKLKAVPISAFLTK